VRRETADAALIGCGAGGTALLAQLALRLKPGAAVVVADPAAPPLGGDAFSTARDEHLLNVRAANMSALAHLPLHFAAFAAMHLGRPVESVAQAYLPRRLYGAYLSELWDETRALMAKRGIGLRLVSASVTRVSMQAGEFVLSMQDGSRIKARNAVLAIGAPAKPGAPEDGWFEGPWQLTERDLAAYRAKGTALIAGTGLTAIDAMLTLEALGWGGPIVARSPSGKLPLAHEAAAPPPAAPPEMEAASLSRLTRSVVRFARTAPGGWQAALAGLRGRTAALWGGLPPEDRLRAMGRVMTLWSVHRHRAPAEAMARVEAMIARGALRIERGRVSGPPGPGIAFVIDARGRSYRYLDEPLIAGAVSGGLAKPSPTGLGLMADAAFRVGRGAAGDLFALGALHYGERLETVAMPEIAAQAEIVAAAIAGEAQPSA
jgi:uncharacterized NAD(P)/FAD-binding protein YdhS